MKGQIVLTREEIKLRGSETFLNKLRKKYLKKDTSVVLQIEVSDTDPYKTYDQLGYLFNELAEKAIIGYQNNGLNVRTRRKAVAKLCMDLDFVEHIEDGNGKVVCVYPISISGAKIGVIADLIDKASIHIRVEMGLDVMTPAEWFKLKSIK